MVKFRIAVTKFRSIAPHTPAIIYYNSLLLSNLLEKYQETSNKRAIEKLLKISPVAWQHIHLLGHYTFCSNKHPIDMEEIISNIIKEIA